ncbi:MAG: sugar kinase [Desulfobacterales bacterium]|nr:sugar kinase [Pseudomonadota bacterium]MBU4354067.1 sugar kinase [Pseudomonadota bacterium]MCG2773939.1 sugar kinase [Desulfobacterales bacterium]
MLAVVGTIPDEELPLVAGPVTVDGQFLVIQGHKVPISRGTAGLLAAAATCLEVLRKPAPFAFLVGDIGRGQGSSRLYEYLTLNLGRYQFSTLTFHYVLPIVDWHNRVLFAVQEMAERPRLIADAGFMYVAKMSGQAPEYDLFTPDAGELAFLADEEAPHPFYTRGFILHEDNQVPELIARAYAYDNAARHLLVKGQKDYVATKEGIVATIAEPVTEALEPIGGTGDSLTGIVSALIAAGFDIVLAAILAARVNRVAGYLAHPTPATNLREIVNQIPAALKLVLKEHHGKGK